MNYKIVSTSPLNIRSGPGMLYEAVGQQPSGDIIEALPYAGWLPILLDDDSVGWVSTKYLVETKEEIPETPEQTIPASPGKIIEMSNFPMMQNQLQKKFGAPADPANYLVIMDFKEFASAFAHVKDYEGHQWSCRIYGHALMAAPLYKAFKLLVNRGFNTELKTFDGCLCIRPPKGGSMPYSVHAWGMACDFNAGSNAYGATPKFSGGFVKCFAESGFEWGGLWTTPDGMHFQLPWVRIREDGNPLNPVAFKGV